MPGVTESTTVPERVDDRASVERRAEKSHGPASLRLRNNPIHDWFGLCVALHSRAPDVELLLSVERDGRTRTT